MPLVNQNETIDYLMATANRENNDGTDWKQLFYSSQIIYGENKFSTFVKKLEQYASMANKVKYYINPEHVEDIRKMILDDVMTYIYSIAAKSSENGGELINMLSTESKRVDYNMFGGEKGKSESLISKVQNYDRSKLTQPVKNEMAGFQNTMKDFKM